MIRIPLFVLCALLCLSGCSERDIARAETFLQEAQTKLAQAESALALADEMTKGWDSEKKAAYLQLAKQGVELAQIGAEKADQLVAAAKAGGWKAVVGSIVGTALSLLIPGIGMLRAGMGWKQAAIQTFQGLQTARKAMGDTEWDASVAPALEGSQDESVKRIVKAVVG